MTREAGAASNLGQGLLDDRFIHKWNAVSTLHCGIKSNSEEAMRDQQISE